MRYENKQLTDLEMDAWADELNRRLGDYVTVTSKYINVDDAPLVISRESTDKFAAFMKGWKASSDAMMDYGTDATYEPPAWKLSMVEIRREELEGLDRAGFRDLVRKKLQVVGDDFLRHWEEWNRG
jgi:hypothetical protein